MSRRAVRLRDLAAEVGLDLDEALVMLWDAGFEYLGDPDDRIPAKDVAKACTTLGVPPRQRENSIKFWLALTGLSRAEFVRRAAEAGISIAPNARSVPKGSIRRLRRMFGEYSGHPNTAIPAVVETFEPLRWEQIGSAVPHSYLTEEDVLAIHAALVEEAAASADPIFPPGIASESLLSSALSRPTTSFGGTDKYQTVEMAAAALLHSLIHNHSFHNGNKRTAIVSVMHFIDRNSMVLTCNEQDLFKFLLRVGQHGIEPLGAPELPDREVLHIAR